MAYKLDRSEHAELMETISTIESEVDDLKTAALQFDELQDAYDELDGRFDTATSELEDVQGELTELQSRYEDLVKERDDLEEAASE